MKADIGQPDSPAGGDAYLPIKALAGYSGLSVRTLRGYLVSRTRPLPFYRVGTKILVRRSEFDTWASQFRVLHPTLSIDALVEDVCEHLR